jgi:hypothetical protein
VKNRRRSHTSQVINIAARPPKDGNADRPTLVSKTPSQKNPRSKDKYAGLSKWYDIEDLIAGLDAPVLVKYLLERIRRRTNPRKRFAWVSQKSLAWDMGVSRPTVERAFAQAKTMGVVGVRRVRTGKNPTDQHNEFWIIPERMKQLQRPPLPPETDTEHPSPVMGDTNVSNLEHPSNRARTSITSDGGSTKYFKTASDASLPVGGSADSGGVTEFGHAHHHHPPYPKKETDDARVQDNSNEQTTSKPKTVPAEQKQTAKKRKIPPPLYAWMRTRILKRSGTPVANTSAYVRKSEDQFLADLPLEVTEFLVEVAEQFLRERDKEKPGQTIYWLEVCEALDSVVQRHQLPTAGISFDAVIRAASDLIGMTERKTE